MCMFIYLFVVYFSFAPVISAITHRYCELFYIQVRMMVIKTETLTSTSHHDIFTYLDYIFSCYLHIYIYISWSTVVEGDPMAPFLIATQPRCRGGRNSLHWTASLTLDPYFIIRSVKQGGFKYHIFFSVFCMIRSGIEPQCIKGAQNWVWK